MTKVADDLFADIQSVSTQATERKNPVDNSNGNGGAQFFSEAEIVEETSEKPELLNEKAARASGKTGAFLTAGLIETVFGLTESILHTTRFTNAEKERLITLDEVSANQWNEDDERLNRKFLALTKKHEKIKEKIDLQPDEVAALTEAFTEYSRITGKSMNPQLIVWSTIGKIFVNRSIDIFL